MQAGSTEVGEVALLRLNVLGELRVETSTGEAVLPNNRRANLILAILCLQPDLSIDREALAKLLWPDRFVPQAKASLRQCLLELKRSLGDHGLPGLAVSRAEVALDHSAFRSDLEELSDALASGEIARACDLLRAAGNRALLEGVSLNPAFDDWLAARREYIDAGLRSAIDTAIRTADRAGGERLLDAARDRFPAFRTFPPELGQLAIAVLPFTQVDEIGGDFFLSDGVTDELSSQLGRLNGIALAGRTSVNAVASRGATLIEMAEILRVSHLVEGEVRRTTTTIEIRIALIEGTSGTELWSDRISGSIEQFLHSRNLIGANIIAAMCRVLGITPSPAPLRRMTTDREAYALYLQGREMVHRLAVEGAIEKGIAFFERALEIDPDFAECWTALGDAHIMMAATTPSLTRVEQSAEGARCAACAVALDPGQGHAYSIMGVHEWTLPKPARALELSFEAYARDPNQADVASRLGACLLYLGKAREALAYIEEAVDRDPIYGRNYIMLSTAHLSLGNLEMACEAGQRAVELGMPGIWLAVAQFASGDYEAAVSSHFASRIHLGTVIMRPPGVPPMDDAARDAYFDFAARGLFSGSEADRAAYCQMLDGLHLSMPDPYDTSIALPAIWMGHSRLVMKIFSERIHPANMFALMSLWTDIDPINRTRLDPGFMDFAARIGMVEAWDQFGWPDLLGSGREGA
ncbi:hypothetical protein [Erythrobacter sp. JK5]|uniref:hypothetical protein n=1 Tax=Erythrobacter sp. JK5 TaxID=2829500 RepID=UPI001BA86739|nr:hypothetical protein [Erythrobacter sp. JK5]QUL37646.1 hypothetical protein KDC96_15075 [Erythrobacter sp. JK5]